MGVGEFLRWWWSELAGMLPDGWRRRFERRRDTVILSSVDDEVRISLRDNGRVEELGRIDMTLPDAGERMMAVLAGMNGDSTRVEVAVAPDKVLRKQIQLPLAAEENLRQVLGFEMQRQTPFRAEQVYFNYRVVARRPHSQQLDVRLSVAPRAAIESVMDPIANWHLEPDESAAKTDQDDGVFTFVPGDVGQRPASALKRGLVLLNIVLLVAVVAIPFMQQQRYLEELGARFGEVREAATTASDLQQRIDRRQARSQYLFAQKSARLASVQLLEELSQRLPDDTWLFRAEVRAGKVHLQGTSTRASALIAELEGSRFLEDVRFASPVTQDGASGRERFHLSARIVSPATPAETGSHEGKDS